MSYYFNFEREDGRKGVARVFVNNDGSDEVQLVQTSEDAVAYCERKNKRWTEQARQLAARPGNP